MKLRPMSIFASRNMRKLNKLEKVLYSKKEKGRGVPQLQHRDKR